MDQVDNGDQPGYSPGLLKSWSDRGFPPSTTLIKQVGNMQLTHLENDWLSNLD